VKLEGSLDTFSLRELIEMVVYSSVTGVLCIRALGGDGRLFFRESGLYHVEHGRSRGLEALAELLDLHEGSFSFLSDVVSDQESLYGSIAVHLQNAERIAARWRQIRPYVPSLDMVPQLLVAREAALRRAHPGQATTIGAVDGRASLRQIAAALGWSELDLAEAVAELSLDGIVELRPSRAVPHGQPAAEHPREGFFDRLLARTAQPHDEHQPEAAPRLPAEELTLRLLRGSG
jgi:hypothetical protein